jgi:hypothetical protein
MFSPMDIFLQPEGLLKIRAKLARLMCRVAKAYAAPKADSIAMWRHATDHRLAREQDLRSAPTEQRA